MDGWNTYEGSEAQNIIRQAEIAPDSPFRPRFRRRFGETVAPPVFGGRGASSSGTVGVAVPKIKLDVLIVKQPIAEVLVSFLTLRDVFKMGMSCRDLMNRLLLGAAGACAIGALIDPSPTNHHGVSNMSFDPSGLQMQGGVGEEYRG